ncbi:MAG: hypothetical protein EHM48_05165 [Planctomycetaceae bacterium]|nr:MAG: hypothetical protein EHM48_05165 [Planctomycetaceae bacterium]
MNRRQRNFVSVACLAAAACLAAFFSTGCTLATPKPAAPTSQPVRLPDRVVFYVWDARIEEGTYKTSRLVSCEVDFAAGKIRAVEGLTFGGQEPRLVPSSIARVADALADVAWQNLPSERALILRTAMQAWLNTNPPPLYTLPPQYSDTPLPREIVILHAEELAVSGGGYGDRTTKADASGRSRVYPPVEWTVLTTIITQYAAQIAVPAK